MSPGPAYSQRGQHNTRSGNLIYFFLPTLSHTHTHKHYTNKHTPREILSFRFQSEWISTFRELPCSASCPLLLPNEQLLWNEWRISAPLNGTIIVIARGGGYSSTFPHPRFPADLRLSRRAPTPPPLDGHHQRHLKHPLSCSSGVALTDVIRLSLSLAR